MTDMPWAQPPVSDHLPHPPALGHAPAPATATARTRLVLLSTRSEPDGPPPGTDRTTGPDTGRTRTYATGAALSCGPGGRPESRDPASGDSEFCRTPHSDPPDALIGLRFADASALERAGVAFGAGRSPGLGDAWSDPATLTLRIAGDAGVETLRAVLAVLDAAAVSAEWLTVHTRELGDVHAAFTGLP
ncbi:hypothetical protein ACWC0C_17660 [Streptomyces sp. NPDC001709]